MPRAASDPSLSPKVRAFVDSLVEHFTARSAEERRTTDEAAVRGARFISD
jgi:hypothetical protein